MIADTTFLIDYFDERRKRQRGRATQFLIANRNQKIRITVVSIAEFAAGFDDPMEARQFLDPYPIFRLFPESAYEAGAVDHELMQQGARMGEGDTLIAGIARYYGETLISNDAGFRRVRNLRVLSY